jgi:hypothetical protein
VCSLSTSENGKLLRKYDAYFFFWSYLVRCTNAESLLKFVTTHYAGKEKNTYTLHIGPSSSQKNLSENAEVDQVFSE